MAAPTLHVEATMWEQGHIRVAGMDEVGRGALAGPVAVGVCVLTGACAVPAGLRDSKLLTGSARERMAPMLQEWPAAWAVGYAQAAEIDQVGIIGALRLAGNRALAMLDAPPHVILLDGTHNWLTPPAQQELDLEWTEQGAIRAGRPSAELPVPVPDFAGQVIMRAKADRDCASVAAASVLAKVARDRLMGELDAQYPGYGWAQNKGYGSAAHREAIGRLGVTCHHRQSWHLTSGPPTPRDL